MIDSAGFDPGLPKPEDDPHRLMFSVFKGEDRKRPLPGYYSLNYHAPRVNFFAHQRRTLALARYLAKVVFKERIEAGNFPRIAVLGGGIGGVTCFVALHAYKLFDTHVFDVGKTLMGVQKDCKIRFGHPTAIDWPQVPRFTSTTDMPFFNWGAGTAHDVVEQMHSDPMWAKIKETREDKIHRDVEVRKATLNLTEAEASGASQSSWELDLHPLGEGVETTYDVVINALGFGSEKHVKHSRSEDYWWNDNLENFMRERQRYGKRKRIVSGAGDGALIDLARIGFGLEPGDDPVGSMIASLRAEKYQQPPQKPEFGDLFSTKGKPVETEKSPFEIALCDADEAGEIAPLETFYVQKILSELKQTNCSEELRARFEPFRSAAERHSNGAEIQWIVRDSGRRRVSSVANRLLAAILIRESGHRLKVEKGELFEGDEKTPPSFKIRGEEDDDDVKLSNHLVFLRHGPEGVPERLIPDLDGAVHDKEGVLEKSIGADFSAEDRYEFLENLDLLPSTTRDKKVFAWDYKLTCTAAYLKRTLKLPKVIVSYVELEDGDAYLQIDLPLNTSSRSRTAQNEPDFREKIMKIGGFDRQMFGAPIAYNDIGDRSSGFSGDCAWVKDTAAKGVAQ